MTNKHSSSKTKTLSFLDVVCFNIKFHDSNNACANAYSSLLKNI